MTNAASAASARSAATPIIIAGAIMLALSFGVRTVFGVFLEPISADLFNGKVEIFALSIAIQNLVWGFSQPFFGALADRVGDRPALWLGLACYAVGMVLSAYGVTAAEMHVGVGLLVGAGISGTAFGIVLSVVGRVSAPEKRSQNLGLVAALGSSGQVLVPLIASELVKSFDWRMSLLAMTLLLAPMALCIPFLRAPAPKEGAAKPAATGLDEMPFGQALMCACGHSSYLLLTLGFFVCGFHIAFITAHFPNFVVNFCTGTDMDPDELRAFGLQTISIVGAANIIGTFTVGQIGARVPKPYLLASIYALRSVVIILFISLPITPTSVMLFSFFMGLLWLSTVPPTSALVLGMFGARYMGTLYGIVFLSHQVGAFLGVWLGGVFFDTYNSYDIVWWASIGLGIASALAHLPVRERPFEAARA